MYTNLKIIQNDINNELKNIIVNDDDILNDAIKYVLFGGGKRLRPFLILETIKLKRDYNNDDIKIASAVELLHNYSLVHDDLPSMDNDDYRRGNLTCHKKYNEETAILVGDSLLTLAFEVISTAKNITYEKRCKIIEKLSKAAGYKGMCLGQSKDIIFEKNKKSKNQTEAEEINKLKTGLLFKACVEIACILADFSIEDTEKMIKYALNFGQAFQLHDDLEDNEIKEEEELQIKNSIIELIEESKKNLSKISFKCNKKILEELSDFCLN